MSARCWQRRRHSKRLQAAIRHVERHPYDAVLVGTNCYVMGIARALDLYLLDDT